MHIDVDFLLSSECEIYFHAQTKREKTDSGLSKKREIQSRLTESKIGKVLSKQKMNPHVSRDQCGSIAICDFDVLAMEQNVVFQFV